MRQNMFSHRDLIALSLIPQVGPRRLRVLVDHFGTLAAVSGAAPHTLSLVPGFSGRLARHIFHHFRSGECVRANHLASEQLGALGRTGGRIVCLWEKCYPMRLAEIYDPPPVLFGLGEFPERDFDAVAIVGTRRPSQYGRHVAEYFSRELCALGITVVSGMARGIDTVVHETALKSGGRTIAVVGTGLDVTYPPENGALGREIAGRGCVVSEFLFGTGPEAANFPRRNRIISGLCLGTIVVESDINGGAMITARMALDQDREVFAVPGPARSVRSRGCHSLLREGRAKLADCAEDVLAEIAIHLKRGARLPTEPDSTDVPEVPDAEREICALLDPGPVHIDELAEVTGVEIPDLLVRLLTLEMKNLVRQLPGKYFMKAT